MGGRLRRYKKHLDECTDPKDKKRFKYILAMPEGDIKDLPREDCKEAHLQSFTIEEFREYFSKVNFPYNPLHIAVLLDQKKTWDEVQRGLDDLFSLYGEGFIKKFKSEIEKFWLLKKSKTQESDENNLWSLIKFILSFGCLRDWLY